MHATNRSYGKKKTRVSQHGKTAPKSEPTTNSKPSRNPSNLEPIASTPADTPPSSKYPSTYSTEDEDEDEDESLVSKKSQVFRLLDLPSELRTKIYAKVFFDTPAVIDLDPYTFGTLNRQKTLALFKVSRHVRLEATHQFFSTHTFRLFPTYPGRYFKTKKPLLARLPAHYRASITSLELRLGPGWNNPPPGWVVNDALGLADCTNARVLKVFVECDPSDAFFKGFRMGEGAYERFSAALMDSVLASVPSIMVVEFDAYSSVRRTGDMMSGLGDVVRKYDKAVGWGPERGWEEESDQTWLDAVLIHGSGKRLTKSAVVFGERYK